MTAAPKTLWKIGDDLHALDALLREMDGDVSDPEVEAAIDAWLAENKGNLEAKLDSYAYLITERESYASVREAEAKTYNDEINRLLALAQTDRNLAKRLKDRLKLFLELQGLKRIETPLHKFTVAGNGGKAPLQYPDEWDNNVASAPEAFHRRVIVLDKDAIRAAADTDEYGDCVKILDRGTHLRVS